MRKTALIIFLLTLFASCDRSTDPVIAEAFQHKLYLSETTKQIPYATSKEDSLLFIEQFIDEWILRQTLLATAKKGLTLREQDFSSQIEQYKELLLINAYFGKIDNDPSLFTVSNDELAEFLNETKAEEIPEYREMVKLNYVKLMDRSKVYKKIKDLFFEEKDRIKALQQLEQLCSDTIEYYLDSEQWFYSDFIERELPFSISDKEKAEKYEFVKDGYRFLVHILERKQQLQTTNVMDDRKIAQALLMQQKKNAYFKVLQDSLVQKALSEKKVVKYPI